HWSAHRPYNNPDAGLWGAPSVCTEMTLTFKECEIMQKRRHLSGYILVPPIGLLTLASNYMTHHPLLFGLWCLVGWGLMLLVQMNESTELNASVCQTPNQNGITFTKQPIWSIKKRISDLRKML